LTGDLGVAAQKWEEMLLQNTEKKVKDGTWIKDVTRIANQFLKRTEKAQQRMNTFHEDSILDQEPVWDEEEEETGVHEPVEFTVDMLMQIPGKIRKSFPDGKGGTAAIV